MTRRRADAVQNRDKLLQAAQEVFLELGLNAPLDLIAERAGVGRATLFRNFADRHALILGLLDRGVADMEARADMLKDDPAALVIMLRQVADHTLEYAPLTEYWQAIDHGSEAFRTSIERVLAVFEAPVARAVASGTCRRDLQASDVLLAISMVNGPLIAPTEELRRQLAERAWRFAIDMLQLREPSAPMEN
ncbi:TetR/AcrR family transcriptional regulator [Rhizobium sp. C4]|uniref:TetR/AcrR family transcriptional regulator n=1 Tax=Rhizobium sp. C4 TaxID=1349800 RepID=UPI001E2EB300|nr:TetR/AcrR family transcriptional regulator [Rhizobium sp. C4]MCD2172829.1 TetR/AcrR family transcriptional regulator [Rhizobium sp. C4]